MRVPSPKKQEAGGAAGGAPKRGPTSIGEQNKRKNTVDSVSARAPNHIVSTEHAYRYRIRRMGS